MANKVILVGNLGKDPDLRYTPNGASVVTFSVATSERFKDKTGEKREETTWHNVVAWNQLAEICGQYLKKGSKVYLEGKIKNRSYDKDGITRYVSEVVVDQMEMLGDKTDVRSGERTTNLQRFDRAAEQRSDQPPVFSPDDDIPF